MGSERGRAHAHMYLSDFTGTFIYIYIKARAYQINYKEHRPGITIPAISWYKITLVLIQECCFQKIVPGGGGGGVF